MNKYLLGATKDNELIFGEFGITERNGYPEFTASFDTVLPFAEDDVDATEYYESLVDEMDKEWKYDMCERFDCSPSELPDRLQEANGSDPQDIKDCSIYSEIIDVDGTDYYFESQSGGQHDTRDEIGICVSQNCYDRLHDLWDKWHLKKVDETVISEVNKLKTDLINAVNMDEQEWIRDYIRNMF